MKSLKLDRSFYERDTLIVARELLGMSLVHHSKDGLTSGIIVEAEAYIGLRDAASHAYKGRRTKRTEVQFGPGGYAYIYQIHGKYFNFDVVTEKIGVPAAVLVRALEPVEGIDLMAKRRGFLEINDKSIVNLTNGPAKLCQAMGIDKSLYGVDLCGDVLFIERPDNLRPFKIAATPRINIAYSGDARQYPWRFIIQGNRFVSHRTPVFSR